MTFIKKGDKVRLSSHEANYRKVNVNDIFTVIETQVHEQVESIIEDKLGNILYVYNHHLIPAEYKEPIAGDIITLNKQGITKLQASNPTYGPNDKFEVMKSINHNGTIKIKYVGVPVYLEDINLELIEKTIFNPGDIIKLTKEAMERIAEYDDYELLECEQTILSLKDSDGEYKIRPSKDRDSYWYVREDEMILVRKTKPFKVEDIVSINEKGLERLKHIKNEAKVGPFEIIKSINCFNDYKIRSLNNQLSSTLMLSADEIDHVDIKIETKSDKENKKEKGENNMNNLAKKIFGEIGQLKSGVAALTFNGQIAFKRENGDYVRYNTETKTIENQMDLVIKGTEKMMYVMPYNVVAVGDILKYRDKFAQVIAIKENGSLIAIDFETGTEIVILKETNIFGIQFYMKVVSLLNMQDSNMPGGFNPMMLMLLNKEDKENKDDDMMKAILMSQMFTGQGMNPLMMMAMINNNNESDMMNTILLLQMCSGQGFMHGTPINNYSSQGANTLTMFSKEMFDSNKMQPQPMTSKGNGLSEEQFERLLEEMKNLDKVNLEDIDPSDFE